MLKIQALKDEFIYQATLESGLVVAIHPKPEFHNTLVSYQVKFGGSDLRFKYGDQSKTLPAGTAHYLEHLMFHNQGIDIPEAFAEVGAEINAFTTASITSYKFKTINNLDILLDVFMNNFMEFEVSDELIQKEHNIIKHELVMSDDSVHYDMHQTSVKMMYDDYSITSDIGGSVSDIKKIDRAVLMDAFDTFYHPKNCVLVITGNVDQVKILDFLARHPYNKKQWTEHKEITQIIENKPRRIHTKTKHVKNLEEPMNCFMIRIPENMIQTTEREMHNIALGSIMGNVFGLGSETFDFLEKQNLMNVTFHTKFSIEKAYGYLKIYIQTNKIKRYSKTMREIVLDIFRKPLDEDLFNINKKNVIGNYITLFDSLERIHNLLSVCVTENLRIDDFMRHILNLTIEDLESYKSIFVPENIFELTYLKAKK